MLLVLIVVFSRGRWEAVGSLSFELRLGFVVSVVSDRRVVGWARLEWDAVGLYFFYVCVML
jgi:hypothetical protein